MSEANKKAGSPTLEQRREWAKKGAETRSRRRQQEKEEWSRHCQDKPRAIDLCRRIRDDEDASDADRMEAIRLLEALMKV